MRYYLIAGEPSGDLHGANLMKGLKAHDPEAKFRFWGGDKMAGVGGSGRRCRGAGAAAGRQGQSCCGYACCCQKAAARNTTIESHNIFSPL